MDESQDEACKARRGLHPASQSRLDRACLWTVLALALLEHISAQPQPRTFVVGIDLIGSAAAAYTSYNKTFADYLTRTVGVRSASHGQQFLVTAS